MRKIFFYRNVAEAPLLKKIATLKAPLRVAFASLNRTSPCSAQFWVGCALPRTTTPAPSPRHDTTRHLPPRRPDNYDMRHLTVIDCQVMPLRRPFGKTTRKTWFLTAFLTKRPTFFCSQKKICDAALCYSMYFFGKIIYTSSMCI